jgi:hypothetical protein
MSDRLGLANTTPQQQGEEARRRRPEGETLKELAQNYNVGPATMSRLVV